MFGHLIALLLALLAIDLAPASPSHPWPHAFIASAAISSAIYCFLLLLIAAEKKVKKPFMQWVVHGQLIATLVLLLYVVGFQRFLQVPLFTHTVITLVFFFLYFTALAFYMSWKRASFYFPFLFPFLIYVFLGDLFEIFFGGAALPLLFALLVVSMLLFLPLLFRWLWQCTPLSDSALKDRLDAFCSRQKFRHGGMKIWEALPSSATAAIIGVIPRFRYILFTESLLKTFPEEEIEAVLAHEIGHSKYKHLLFYPFILFGIVPLMSIINDFLEKIPLVLLFIVEGAALLIYFRVLFGFFSRRFEQEADLYTLCCGLPASTMISALKRLGSAHHISLKQPNWHHGSLIDRISALEEASANPSFAKKQHLRLRLILLAYFLVLVLTLSFIMVG